MRSRRASAQRYSGSLALSVMGLAMGLAANAISAPDSPVQLFASVNRAQFTPTEWDGLVEHYDYVSGLSAGGYEGADAHWFRVLLDRGSVSDIAPNGIGSVVRVTFGDRTLTGRIDGGSNYLSQSEMSAHFGLGSTTTIDEVRVEWSNGDVTTLTDVAANQTITITPDPVCVADLDGNGAVGFADLSAMLAAWGACGTCAADLTGDGTVGFADLSALLAQWGGC